LKKSRAVCGLMLRSALGEAMRGVLSGGLWEVWRPRLRGSAPFSARRAEGIALSHDVGKDRGWQEGGVG